MAPLEWNALLEHDLKKAKQAAGWRWVGYSSLILALGIVAIGAIVFSQAEFAEFSKLQQPLIGLGGILFWSGLALAIYGEVKNRRYSRLRAHKEGAVGSAE